MKTEKNACTTENRLTNKEHACEQKTAYETENMPRKELKFLRKRENAYEYAVENVLTKQRKCLRERKTAYETEKMLTKERNAYEKGGGEEGGGGAGGGVQAGQSAPRVQEHQLSAYRFSLRASILV